MNTKTKNRPRVVVIGADFGGLFATRKLATIGRKSAVIEFPRTRFTGFFAWCVWGFAHIYFLIGVRSPVMVATHRLWQYITCSRGARLITGNRKGFHGNHPVP